jgi:glycosyltransferase involved in cell wall biosynthesis
VSSTRACVGSKAVSNTPLTIAIVTPWYGAELTGGAERTAWQMAHGLAERGHDVTVLTTCARAFASDWGVEAYAPGEQREDGIRIHRFAVDARDRNAFDRANDVLLSQTPAFYARHAAAIGDDIADAFVTNSINAAGLIDGLRENAPQYSAVMVLPYPFALCINAVRAAATRAVLVPCLHDEPYAYLPAVADAFRSAARLAFNTAGERRLAYRIFGPAIALKSFVLGQWVDAPQIVPKGRERINGFAPQGRRYLLYLGRRDATKNVDMLVESFATFRRRERMSSLELVLVGPGKQSYADARHGIVDLGEIDDAQKAVLLAGAWSVVQPSLNESFSRVIMEAWSAGAPVVVNARCEATADVVLEAGGGWVAATKAQWSAVFGSLEALTPANRAAFAARGKHYVEEQTSRERILTRLEDAIRALSAQPVPSRFDAPPSPRLLRQLADGRRTVLYAGPLDDKSRVELLVTGFAFLLAFGVDARLVVLGSFYRDESVSERFFDLVASAGLTERVLVFESDDQRIATACYRSASLFWSMAQDGPAEPLFDALGYGVPVFAFASDAARETLASSGLLFTELDDFRALAGLAALILTDASLRATLIDGQRRRFEELCRQADHRLAV